MLLLAGGRGLTERTKTTTRTTVVRNDRKFKFVSKELVACMGTSIGLASLVGALFSKHTSEATLRGLFATMALVAAVMMLVPKREGREDATAEATQFNEPLAVVIAAVIGFLGGMVGLGSYLSKRTPTKALRAILAAFITITAVKMAAEVLRAHPGWHA